MAGNTARNTRCETVLCVELRRKRLTFRRNVASLPGKPDIVFVRQRLAVFCDGDFWHGRKWNLRKEKLARGSNAEYWVAKIEANIARDRHHRAEPGRRAGASFASGSPTSCGIRSGLLEGSLTRWSSVDGRLA